MKRRAKNDELGFLFDKRLDHIRIVQVMRNPDDFLHASWDIEEFTDLGATVIYVVCGIDKRTKNRTKCLKFERDKDGTEISAGCERLRENESCHKDSV
jgi:hypothetical protein